ncbi:MAG TPA: SDR family oxidoreductase [Iamia sp.]|nr:SDR family oxidoreductase [Iamia sp.]
MGLPVPGEGRTALVTGASSGIGVELAVELAKRGHGLTLVARREDLLHEVAGRLTTAHGVRAEVIAADLADPDSRAALVQEVADRGQVVDVLANNAGFSTTGRVATSDPDAEVRLVRVDVEAVVDLCSRIVPGMVERGRGAVLNVASVGAFQPLPGQASYAAAKAFVLSYTDSLFAELRGTGVTATSLCPGPVKTGFGEVAGLTEEESDGALPAFMWETAEDVAKAAVEGMARGRRVVIPGAANLVGAYAGRLAPKSLLVPILARQHPALKR